MCGYTSVPKDGRSCFFVILHVCVCTVTDFSAEDKASSVKFYRVVYWRPRQGI